METTNFKIDNAKSNIHWIGRKVTGAHDGTISIKNGAFEVTDGQLTGGKVAVDTTSIVILDIQDPDTNAQFAGHLASDDFFSSEKHPIADLVITKVTATSDTHYVVEGDLTIKEITHPISFEATVSVNNNALTLQGKVVIDRTKYNMRFRSGNFFTNLGDTLIYDNFELNVNVTAQAA